jgi:peptide deformylase
MTTRSPIVPTSRTQTLTAGLFSNQFSRPSSHFTKLFATLEEEVDPGVVEGTDLSIRKYPDPALRAPNAEVTPEELKDGSIAQIAKEMFLVMYAAEGVGLAAPQVGINKRLMVYNESGDRKKWLDEVVMVNPKIVEFSEGVEVGTEGCLSFPDMNGDVQRSKWIKVSIKQRERLNLGAHTSALSRGISDRYLTLLFVRRSRH